jgi:hypothetical protein
MSASACRGLRFVCFAVALVMRSASELEVRKLVGSAVAERDAVMHDEVRGRTADAANQANVGVYAAVIAGGTIRRGDPVTLE